MSSQQGLKSGSGVILFRQVLGEGDLYLTLFLKDVGLLRISARGAASGKIRFGGGTEPLIWGTFHFYKGKHGGYSLRSVDIADDMLRLRGVPMSLLMSIRWAKLLIKHLMTEHSANDLLANFYWSMKLLEGGVPPEIAGWRFLWRWLKCWGLAPDFGNCPGCHNKLIEATWSSESFFCPQCAGREAYPYSAEVFAFLRASAEAKGDTLYRLLEHHPLPDKNVFDRLIRNLESLLSTP